LYIMDRSGSMEDDEKELALLVSFWIDIWIEANYKGVVTRFIAHDAVAEEVDREKFFHTRVSGGTIISSAYELLLKILEEYPIEQWNIYVFQFSDGDNLGEDNEDALSMLEKEILPMCNLFGFGQVGKYVVVDKNFGTGGKSGYGSMLEKGLMEEFENLSVAFIRNKNEVRDSIKYFLGKGI